MAGVVTSWSLLRIFKNKCSTYHTHNVKITCLFQELIKIDLLIKDLNCYVKVILNTSSII